MTQELRITTINDGVLGTGEVVTCNGGCSDGGTGDYDGGSGSGSGADVNGGMAVLVMVK